MSKKTKKNNTSGKVLAGTLAVALGISGGVAGGFAIANNDVTSRLSTEKQKGYEEGYEEGVKVNVGVPEDEVQQREEEARQEGYDEGYQKGKEENQGTHTTSGQKFNLDDFEAQQITVEQIDDEYTLFSANSGKKTGLFLLNKTEGTYEEISKYCNGFVYSNKDYVFLEPSVDEIGRFNKETRSLEKIQFTSTIDVGSSISLSRGVLKNGLLFCRVFEKTEGGRVRYVEYLPFDQSEVVFIDETDIQEENAYAEALGDFIVTSNKEETYKYHYFDETTKTLKETTTPEIQDRYAFNMQLQSPTFENDKCILFQVWNSDKIDTFYFNKSSASFNKMHFQDEKSFEAQIETAVDLFGKTVLKVYLMDKSQATYASVDETGLLTLLTEEEELTEQRNLLKLDDTHFIVCANNKFILFDNMLTKQSVIEFQGDFCPDKVEKLGEKFLLSNGGNFCILNADYTLHKLDDDGYSWQFSIFPNPKLENEFDTKYTWDFISDNLYYVSNGYTTYKFNIETFECTVAFVNDLTTKL